MVAHPISELPAHRDYVAEMRAIIDAEMHPGDSAPVVAARIVAKLRSVDPYLLAGWLDLGAAGFIREAIGAVDRSARGRARRGAGAHDFGRDAEAGDVSGWLSVPFVVDDGQHRKPLGDMRKPELLYVSAEYVASARESRMEAAFFRALAKKVDTGRVRDCFSEAEIADLRRSIVS